MSHKVSLWIVIALVGALAAMTAAVVVLATNDNDGWSGPRETRQSGDQDPWQMPVMGQERHARGDDGEAGLLPWALFAIATGTAAGLLLAWSPWRRTPAPVVAGGGGQVPPRPDVMTAAPVEAAVAEVAEETAANEAQPAAVEEDARPPDA